MLCQESEVYKKFNVTAFAIVIDTIKHVYTTEN